MSIHLGRIEEVNEFINSKDIKEVIIALSKNKDDIILKLISK